MYAGPAPPQAPAPPPMPADGNAPGAKRQRVEFVLQPEQDFLQANTGSSKVRPCFHLATMGIHTALSMFDWLVVWPQ